MRILSLFLVLCLIAPALPAESAMFDPRLPVVKASILAGDGETNPGTGSAHDITVLVQDQNGKRLEGANVTIRFPEFGPSAFLGTEETRMLTIRTDASGRATLRGIHTSGPAGTFTYKVAVEYRERGDSILGTQTNAAPEGGVPARWLNKKNVAIMVIAAGGVLAGVLAATLGGASGGSKNTPFQVTAGTPVLTAPQ